MIYFLGIIVAILLFSIIVFIHELGHFSAARFFGVRVEEFGIGIPPRAKKLFRDKKGTLFSLNWLPIGGFVKITGEQIHTFSLYDSQKKLYNNYDLEKDIKSGKNIFDKHGDLLSHIEKEHIISKLEENNAPYNLANKSSVAQAIVILAGVFMNFLLAIIIFSSLFFFGIKPIGINDKIPTDLSLKIIPTYEQALESGLIQKFPGIKVSPIDGSIAQKAGLKKGDIITQINNQDINSYAELSEILSTNGETEVILTVSQGENIRITPSSEGKIGAYIGENVVINTDFQYKFGLLESIKYGTLETYNQSLLTFQGLGNLLRKIFTPETKQERTEALEQVSGPIGLVGFIANSITAGFVFVLIIGAVISINLGVFNLLPIPALDGGRFLFITINGFMKKLFGKKIITEKTEGMIHVGFFLLLIALSFIIAYNDVSKIINN